MMRVLFRWVVWVLPLALVGCASDPRETRVRAVLGNIESAATYVADIKSAVSEAVKKADNKKLNKAELEKTASGLDGLKNVAKEMQKTKQQIEGLAASTPKEQRDALAEQFRGKLTGAIAHLDEERRGLEKTLAEAETIDPDAVKDLRAKLTEAEGSFTVMARQR